MIILVLILYAIYLTEALLFYFFLVVNYSVHAVYSRLIALISYIRISQRHATPITFASVCSDIKYSKSNSVNIDGISKVHVSQTCPVLVLNLQLLFKTCIYTSSIPESFLCSTTRSILKRGTSPADCYSYRPIAISCNISKLLEYFILPI